MRALRAGETIALEGAVLPWNAALSTPMSDDFEGIYSRDFGVTWKSVIGVHRPDKLADRWRCIPVGDMPMELAVQALKIHPEVYLASRNLKYLFSKRPKQ